MRSLYVAVCLFVLAASALAVNIGQNCQSDTECTDTAANSYCWFAYEGCTHGVCTCANNYYAASNTECRMRLSLGAACTTGNQGDDDCDAGTHDSVCQQDVCTCPDDKPQHMDVNGEHYCYHAAFGEECNGHNECLTRTTSPLMGQCTADNTCGCADTAMRNSENGQMCRLATRNEACTNDDQGVNCNKDLGLECIGDVCVCPENWMWMDGTCMHNTHTMASEGQECDTDRTAQDAEVCNAGLVCGNCPENAGSHPVCLSTGGASAQTATITSVLASAVFVALRMIL